MCAPVFIEADKCLLKRSGASCSVIRRVDSNATGRLAPFRYVFNELLVDEFVDARTGQAPQVIAVSAFFVAICQT